jgi:hypothetical protein
MSTSIATPVMAAAKAKPAQLLPKLARRPACSHDHTNDRRKQDGERHQPDQPWRAVLHVDGRDVAEWVRDRRSPDSDRDRALQEQKDEAHGDDEHGEPGEPSPPPRGQVPVGEQQEEEGR